MGNSAPQPDARSLRTELEGLTRVEQHRYAYNWAHKNNCVVDLFGDFAESHHLIPFRSGNESENWLDTENNIVYKLNTLMHVGENIARLLLRIELFNSIFEYTKITFIGFQVFSETHVCPVFSQPFIDEARFATYSEIKDFMNSRGFSPTSKDGEYSNGKIIVSDLRPKNVLVSYSNAVFVIDADADYI
ncbi:MAG: hypothetical protein E7074_02380 [Bacteroidales bacterium]|nr:hypothetical protein [Bacteroidales bacterium]